MPRRSANDKSRALGIARQIARVFGPVPLLSSESHEDFRGLHADLILDMKPTGFVMRMLVYDVAVIVWETLRLRRYKTGNIERARFKAALDLGREFLGDVDPKSARDLLTEGTPLRQKLTAALAAHHLRIDDVIDAQAFHSTASINDKIDARMLTLQAGLNSTLRQHEAYRERAVRKVADNVIDVDVDELQLAPPKPSDE